MHPIAFRVFQPPTVMNAKTASTYGKEFATRIAHQPLSATKMATNTVKPVTTPVSNV